MSVLKQPLRFLAFTLALALHAYGGPGTAQTPQWWSSWGPESLNSRLAQLDILVAGTVQDVRSPEDVHVYQRYAGFGIVRILQVEVLAVIQGAGVSPHDVISVVVIPELGHGNPPPSWSHAEAVEHHRQDRPIPRRR